MLENQELQRRILNKLVLCILFLTNYLIFLNPSDEDLPHFSVFPKNAVNHPVWH